MEQLGVVRGLALFFRPGHQVSEVADESDDHGSYGAADQRLNRRRSLGLRPR